MVKLNGLKHCPPFCLAFTAIKPDIHSTCAELVCTEHCFNYSMIF